MDKNTTYFWLTFNSRGENISTIPLDHGEVISRLNQILFTSLFKQPDDAEQHTRVELELGFAVIQACNQIIQKDLHDDTQFDIPKIRHLLTQSAHILDSIQQEHIFTYPFNLEEAEQNIHLAFLLWILSKPQFQELQKHLLPPDLNQVLKDADFYHTAEKQIIQPLLKKTYHAYHEKAPLPELAKLIIQEYPLNEQLQMMLYRSLDRLAEMDRIRIQTNSQLEYTFETESTAAGPSRGPESTRNSLSEAVESEQHTDDTHRGTNLNTSPEWGRELIILAKLLPVWLHQLSIKYKMQISTLDQIPEDELMELSDLGITALWLVGVWQRSPASRKIKNALGNPFALASAYSIFDYEIDPSLGGSSAIQALKDKASRHGIHLGADVIPNHTAIDSKWLKEHPEWFISADQPPFPSYTFTGQNLSDDENMDVRLEDHYYDHKDAAVVFKYLNPNRSPDPLYIYHGNDGTHIPWNDTAQLNYLNPDVQKKMIDTIISVSRDFPLIRLDAAMTLTRLHYKRLWFPPPGEGGAIPSRSGHMASNQAFDSSYGPREFWQEALIALNKANPNALLMAEAFWLMEPYFINHIGMHKVYHSAFMNLLRDHFGQRFNEYLTHLLGHYPLSTLNHFVNFLSTPDEAPAAVSFGKGDRYWAAATLLITFPGTPLFSHNQWDGLEEQYGMEFAAPMNNIPKDQGFYEYHRTSLLPLLKYRKMFSSAEGFRLCRFESEDHDSGSHVIAFSNHTEHVTSFVVVNYQDSPVSGRLIQDAAAAGPFQIDYLAKSHGTTVSVDPFTGIAMKAWGVCVFLLKPE